MIPGGAALAGRLVLAAAAGTIPSTSSAIDWPGWEAKAFETARREDRPVLLYTRHFACPECDRAERLVLAPAADVLAREFVRVQVDRDVQPAVSDFYRAAAEALDGQSGWPVVAFLLPDGRPFQAITLRAADAAGAAQAFEAEALRQAAAYRGQRTSVDEAARRGLENARQRLERHSAPRPLTAEDTGRALELLSASYDVASDPPFPPRRPRAGTVAALAWGWTGPGDRSRRDQALDALARGTQRDHVGGGFFHGSTAEEPTVPRFDKRLSDNALLLAAFARSYADTRNLLHRDVARQTVAWAVREMRDAAGDFFSSLHRESEGKDGGYYLWSRDEIARALGPERTAELEASYRVVPPGMLILSGSPFAGLGATQEVLMGRRARRVRPPTDGRVVAGWNGLMIGALATSGASLGWSADLEAARRAADAVMARLGPASRLRHSSADAGAPAVLEDYAYLAEGMLLLHRATGEERWKAQALSLVNAAVSGLWDVARGGFFATDRRTLGLPLRIKTARDGDLPSGNAVLARVLLELGRVTKEPRYTRLGDKTLEAFAEDLAREPQEMGTLALVADERLADRSRAR